MLPSHDIVQKKRGGIQQNKFKFYNQLWKMMLMINKIAFYLKSLHIYALGDRHTNVVELNQLIGSQHLDNYNLLQKMSMQLIAIFSYILFISND